MQNKSSMSEPIFKLPPVQRHKPFGALTFARKGYHIIHHGIDRCHSITTGEGVDVVVVDTGIDSTHPELEGKVVSRYNATNDAALDGNGHGTHVAGIIAGSLNMLGVAPDVRLHDCKVLGTDGSGGLAAILEGLEFYLRKGMRLFNMSLGTDANDPTLRDYMAKAQRVYGAIFICAAGNDGAAVDYPAAYPFTYAVAALMRSGDSWKRASFSSKGPEVYISAAGVQIVSSVPNGAYEAFSGTSMATPIVTGCMALMMATRVEDKPKLMELFTETAIDLGTSGHDAQYGFGAIKPFMALNYDTGIETPPDDTNTGEEEETPETPPDGPSGANKVGCLGKIIQILEGMQRMFSN